MDKTPREQAHGEVERIFRILMPQNGLAVREEQIALCHTMLDTPAPKQNCLVRRRRWNRKDICLPYRLRFAEKILPLSPAGGGFHLQRGVAERSHRRICPISIPDFSGEPYYSEAHTGYSPQGKGTLCLRRQAEIPAGGSRGKEKNEEQRKALVSLRNYYDLDDVPDLSQFDREQVCVPKVCEKTCPLRNVCRYRQYLKGSQKRGNFRPNLQSQLPVSRRTHRLQELRPLLNDYQALVIDEAHKAPEAARQMYEKSLSAEDLKELCNLLADENYRLPARRLRERFQILMGAMCRGEPLEEAQRTPFILTPDREAAIRDCLTLLRQLQRKLAPRLRGGSLTGWEERKKP